MKKILFLMAMAIMALSFTACTANEDNPTPEVEFLNFDPLLQWGCSIADVEQHMQKKEWWQDGNEELEYWADPFESWHKWYWTDAENEITEQYLFETEDGKNLRYVMSICWNNAVPADEFVSTLYHQGFHATGEMVDFEGEMYEQFLYADGETEALYSTDEDGYSEVIYRPVKRSQPVTEFPYSQDFENGLGSWTVIDANNDGIAWMTRPTSTELSAHSGNRFAASFSWLGEGVQADEYLVSPEIVLPAGQTVTLSWWFRVNPLFPEDKYTVMLWGNDTGRTTLIDITPTAEQGDWTQQTLDLSAYAGQSAWLAFYHYGYDNNYIALDDILITVGDNTGTAITTASTPTSPAAAPRFNVKGRVGGDLQSLKGRPNRSDLYIRSNR